MSYKKLPLSIVIRAGNDLKGLLRCIDSIDEPVEIVASISNNTKFINKIKTKDIKIATHQYGNWSLAAESGIKIANNNLLIIMDSDSIFKKGAIKHIYKALSAGHLVVQPRIKFLSSSSLISSLISKSRSFENQYEPKAYSPGLGLRVNELKKVIGINGNIYNPDVAYADDGNVHKRVIEKNIPIFVEPKAIIYHDAIPLKHEMKTAYRLGRGNRQGQVSRRNLFYPIIKNFFSKNGFEYLKLARQTHGTPTLIFISLWKIVYVYGYYFESIKQVAQNFKISTAP